jgi:hypothetical protein
VQATRVARTCDFKFARTEASGGLRFDRLFQKVESRSNGWRRSAAGPPRLLALAGMATGSWAFVAAVAALGLWSFRHG